MKTPTPPVVLVLLGFCVGTGFGWLISFSRPESAPVVVEHSSLPPAVVVEASPPPPVAALVPPMVVGDWRLAADEIREYTSDAKEFDSILDAKIAAYPDNPTAKVALLFAAVQWADRVEDSSAMNRKTLALKEFHQYWKRDILWKIESLQYKADTYTLAERTDKKEMEEYCIKEMKRMCEEHELTFRIGRDENTTRWKNYYIASLDRLGQDGRKLDVLRSHSIYHDTSKRRILGDKDRLFLSEMLRAPPGDSAFNWLASSGWPTEEEKTKIDEVRAILIRLLEHEAEDAASTQRSEAEAEISRVFGPQHRPAPTPSLTADEFIKQAVEEHEQANKEYRDLTSDPPLPKSGEKAPPKPPEEKLVPYLKDPTNKDPKANGLGLSLETLTDVVRADLGPPPFPLPLRLTGLEGARNPSPPPPGMISDRAKTQLTYKPRRAVIAYLKKQAGRDIPVNYGKVDVPLLYWASLEEYMAHKDNKAEVYFLIGRNLEHAQRLLLEDPIQIRRSGIGLAEVATMYLGNHMNDKPLEAAIMDLYVMPYLHLGDKRRENHLSRNHLLGSANAAYSHSEFFDKWQLSSEEACREAGDLNGQDAQRFSIAKALIRQQKTDEAIIVLGQITDPGLVAGAKGYAESLRKQSGVKP